MGPAPSAFLRGDDGLQLAAGVGVAALLERDAGEQRARPQFRQPCRTRRARGACRAPPSRAFVHRAAARAPGSSARASSGRPPRAAADRERIAHAARGVGEHVGDAERTTLRLGRRRAGEQLVDQERVDRRRLGLGHARAISLLRRDARLRRPPRPGRRRARAPRPRRRPRRRDDDARTSRPGRRGYRAARTPGDATGTPPRRAAGPRRSRICAADSLRSAFRTTASRSPARCRDERRPGRARRLGRVYRRRGP